MTAHVLQLIHNLKREGAQTMAVNLVTSLDREVARVTVFPWRDGGPYAANLKNAGIKVTEPIRLGLAARIRSALHLRRLIRKGGVDLVHAHMSDSAILAAIAVLGTGTPFIVTHHSNRLLPKEARPKHLVRRWLMRWATGGAALNVGVTATVAARLKEELGLPPDRIGCIANGVAIPDSASAQTARTERRARWGGPGWPHLVALGRLADVKRQDTIIEALSRLRRQLPGARLTIAGDGPLRDSLAERASRLDLQAAVDLVGPIDDVGRLLRQADFFVSTSSYEGLPVAVLEAMSWGVPVIVTDVPGHCDVVRDRIDGCLVPFDDPAALADGIARLAADQDAAESLATAARQRASSDFSATAMAQTYALAYLSALDPAGAIIRGEDSSNSLLESTSRL